MNRDNSHSYSECALKYPNKKQQVLMDDKTSARCRYAIVLSDRVVTAATAANGTGRSTH